MTEAFLCIQAIVTLEGYVLWLISMMVITVWVGLVLFDLKEGIICHLLITMFKYLLLVILLIIKTLFNIFFGKYVSYKYKKNRLITLKNHNHNNDHQLNKLLSAFYKMHIFQLKDDFLICSTNRD